MSRLWSKVRCAPNLRPAESFGLFLAEGDIQPKAGHYSQAKDRSLVFGTFIASNAPNLWPDQRPWPFCRKPKAAYYPYAEDEPLVFGCRPKMHISNGNTFKKFYHQ